MRSARFSTLALALLALPLALAACVSGVNGSVDVAAGTSVSDASTVNGSVHIEANAKADKASTVNGSIHIAENAKVGNAETVNGTVHLKNEDDWEVYRKAPSWQDHEEGHIAQNLNGWKLPSYVAMAGVAYFEEEVGLVPPSRGGNPPGHDSNPWEMDADLYRLEKEGI